MIDSVSDAELEDRVLMAQVPIVRTHTMNPHVRPYLPFDAGALLVGLLVIALQPGSNATLVFAGLPAGGAAFVSYVVIPWSRHHARY